MTRKKIMILGATGMLGNAIYRLLCERKDWEVWGTLRDNADLTFFRGITGNLTLGIDAIEPETIKDAMLKFKPDCVINCIGIIKQLKEAEDPYLTISNNSMFPHTLARYCKELGCRMIHISTDCVFDGAKGNYIETDNSNAKDLYGRTKFLGEVTGQEHVLTIRTSIIGHELKNKGGLVDWFLNQQEPIKGYTKAIFTGFTTLELSRIIADYVLPDNNLFGLYHVSAENISKFALLNLVAEDYNKKISIEPYNDFICDRSLNSDRFKKISGYMPPSWDKMIKEMHDDYINYYEKNI